MVLVDSPDKKSVGLDLFKSSSSGGCVFMLSRVDSITVEL